MKNFQVLSIECINGVNNVSSESGRLYPNSLVLVSKSGTRGVNFITKCRSTDQRTVVKSLLRAVVETQRWSQQENSTNAAVATKRKAINPLSSGLGGSKIWVTNSKGQVISEAAFAASEGMTLRKLFRITKSNPLYTLVIEQGKPWSDEAVAKSLKENVNRTFELLGSMQRFDDCIAMAAKANAAEEKAQKAEQAEEKSQQAEPPVDDNAAKKAA